jgi:hypothetical protein
MKNPLSEAETARLQRSLRGRRCDDHYDIGAREERARPLNCDSES